MLMQRRFEELAVPDYPCPYPAFKGRDGASARFIHCRRPMRVEFDDGAVTEGIYPITLFQRCGYDEVGLFLVFHKEGATKYVTSLCEDIQDNLFDLTSALLGDPIVVRTTGAQVSINPLENEALDDVVGSNLGAIAAG
jgi:hypothetical protein